MISVERTRITALPGIRVIRLISDGMESWIESNICSTPMVICPSKAAAGSLIRPIATILLLLLWRSMTVIRLLSTLQWWQSLLQGSLNLSRVMRNIVSRLQIPLCSLHRCRVRPLLSSLHCVLWTCSCSSLHLVRVLLSLLLLSPFESLRTWPTCHRLLLSNFWGFCGVLECWDLFVIYWLSVCCLSVSIVQTAIIWKWPCTFYHIAFLLRISGCFSHGLRSNRPIWDSLHIAFRVHIYSEMMLYLTCEIIVVVDCFIAITLTVVRHRDSQLLYVLQTSFIFLIRSCLYVWWSRAHCCLINSLCSL